MTELESRLDHADLSSASTSSCSRRSLLGKGAAGLFSLLLIGATLAPIVQNWRTKRGIDTEGGARGDSFPFSYYPMFSQKRSRLYKVNYLVGLDAQGNRHLISHEFAGEGGFNQTRRQIDKLIRRNRPHTLCRHVAAQVAEAIEPPTTEIVTVQIVTGAYEFAKYFVGDKRPVSELVRASCPVSYRAALQQTPVGKP